MPRRDNVAVGNQVQFILVAEFDIDKGSVLTHQYPEKIGVAEEQ